VLVFLEAFFFEAFFLDAFFGTFLPLARASDRPIAIACLRLLTLRPERPLFSVPALRDGRARGQRCEVATRSSFCDVFHPTISHNLRNIHAW
jgi:hypothetical protein